MHDQQQLNHRRHSLAHLLAAAVLELYPDALRTIGPATENGFYYDFDFVAPISNSDLPALEAKMRELLPTWQQFERKEIEAEDARIMFANNPYKLELIEEIVASGEPITLYTSGQFTDLCKGGHTDSVKDIPPDSFMLSHTAGAYWRGDEQNKMLTRIYGLAFNSKKELDEYIHMQEEAKKRDHKRLGKQLGLFTFSETVGKGLPLWTAKGATIRRELERFIVDEELRRGYQHVYTPDIARLELYRKSGHYPYYKDSMYAPIEIDGEAFMLRPMTCPHHFELYLSEQRSYRDLPMRIAEVAKLYRFEQSGELSGLQRVRSFSLADAHIICADVAQAKTEVAGALDLIEDMAKVFGLTMGEHYWYRLSLGDRSDAEKYFKNDDAWNSAEDVLREVLTERSATFVEAPGEAAFYGPKIDIQMRNVNGKEDTAFTVQYDFVMPDRFELTYTAQDGTEKRPLVVHRSSIGAIERILAFLIEHYAGAFPLWLAPVQAVVLPIGESHHSWAVELVGMLQSAGIRASVDDAAESLGKRIREAKLQKIPYYIVVGDEEVTNKTATLESRDRGKIGALSPENLCEQLKNEMVNKK